MAFPKITLAFITLKIPSENVYKFKPSQILYEKCYSHLNIVKSQ